MYELQDSYFVLIDPSFLIIAGSVIIVGSIGFLWMKAKKRSTKN